MKKILTLCIVVKENKILLGMKKRGFGAGRWNGFGGKVEPNETIEDAAKRELKEECEITAVKMEKVGLIDFKFENDQKILETHIFYISEFLGNPTETEEMKPEWFDTNKIPYDKMWSDDTFWLPLLLKKKKFKGEFLFDKPSDPEYSAKIINQTLEEVDLI